jgi:hypothetical protein
MIMRPGGIVYHSVMSMEKDMSEDGVPQEFWDRADEVIAVANEQVKNSTIGKVSSSLLYAAARFNSFNVANSADSIEEMKKDKEEAIKYFSEQYKKMLEENLDDYIENFESYTTKEK